MTHSAPALPRVITEDVGGSPLAMAARRGELSQWYGSQPRLGADWQRHVEEVRRGQPAGSWLARLEPAIAAQGAARARLDRVVAAGGVVVSTGQQAALFGGPLYTIVKAIGALGIADALERATGIPTAVVFWAATDDADFLEAASAQVADADGVRVLSLDTPPPAGTPMSRAPLGDTKALVAALRAACGSAANAEYFEMAQDAFSHPERTIGGAYVRLMRDLLQPLGIGVLDSSHAAYRGAARPILVEALARASDVSRALSECAAAIRAAGFEPQVEDDRGLSLVFALEGENDVKRRIAVKDAAAAARAAGDFAPNVLLRPIVERAILPTVAYVGGPGELAYFAQSNAAAAALGQDPVAGVPRWSCTIVEPFAERALHRLDAKYTELQDLHALERRLATQAMPPDVATAWKRLEEQVQASVRALGKAVQAAELMPPAVIEGLERSLAHRLSKGERRLLAAVKRREERTRRDLAVASGALFPNGKRQERALNFIPMLARGGADLIRDMIDAATRHAETLAQAPTAEPAALR